MMDRFWCNRFFLGT